MRVVVAMNTRIYRGSSLGLLEWLLEIRLGWGAKKSVLAGALIDSLTPPYLTLNPTLIDPHARLGWGSRCDPYPTPRHSEA